MNHTPLLAWVIADGIARHDMAPGMPSIDELDPEIAKPYHDLVARFIMPGLRRYRPSGLCSACWGDGLETYEMEEPYQGIRLCEKCNGL